jgi:PTS system ascorbate-specific IIA component
MLDAVKQTYGRLSMPAKAICVPPDADPDQVLKKAKQITEELAEDGDVLVLTDVYGGTPSNIAHKLHNGKNIFVVSGLSLTMLLRVFNYPKEPLLELVKRAVEAGREGITSTC